MKNKTKKRVGIVAMMLVLILAIGAAAGTTLAKYIYSATVNTSATVAKWGFTVSANTTELFSDKYDASNIVTGDETLDVNASTKVVAPGTSNSTSNEGGEMTITFNGYSEVDALLTIDLSGFKTVWLKYEEDTYYPIKWYINGTLVEHTEEDGTVNNAVVADDIANAIAAALPNGATAADGVVTLAIPASKTSIFGATGKTLTIAWEWEFQTEKTAAENEEGEDDYVPATYYDIEDTILGALAAGETTTIWTSADNGASTTIVDISEYVADKDYNLDVVFNLKAMLVQTTNANS